MDLLQQETGFSHSGKQFPDILIHIFYILWFIEIELIMEVISNVQYYSIVSMLMFSYSFTFSKILDFKGFKMSFLVAEINITTVYYLESHYCQ